MDYYGNSYRGLDRLKHDYFKKYKKRNNVQGFIRLMQNYDASLFQLVKQFVPERAVLHTGLVVESHALHRNKHGHPQPSYQELHWSASIDPEPATAGDILPLTGSIDRFDLVDLNGTEDSYEGTYTYQLNTDLQEELASIMDSPSVDTVTVATMGGDVTILEDEAQGVTLQPAQYAYYTWFHTGSGDQDWVYGLSVGQDVWDPIQPVITQNSVSNTYVSFQDRFGNNFLSNAPYMEYLASQSNTELSSSLRLYGLTSSISLFSSNQTPTYDVVELNGEYIFAVTYTI
jgi:hypothetical protein